MSRPATEGPGFAARRPAWWQQKRARVAASALALAVFHVALAMPAVLADGQTIDEPVHILAGYATLVEDRHDIDRLHPPLSRLILALPLLPLDLRTPPDPLYQNHLAAFDFATPTYSRDFLYQHNGQLTRTILIASRMAVLAVSTVSVLMVYFSLLRLTTLFIATSLGFLYALDPNVLAHGHLATTDTITTAFFFATGLCLMAFLTGHRARWLLLTGVFAGLSLAAKVTGLLVWPSLVLCIGLDAVWLSIKDGRRSPGPLVQSTLLYVRRHGGYVVLSILISIMALWAVYRFELKPLPLDAPLMQRYATVIERDPRLQFLNDIRLPLIDYARTVVAGTLDNSKGRSGFLAGQLYQGGNPFFFAVAFAVKSTPGLLLLLGMSLFFAVQYVTSRRSLTPDMRVAVVTSAFFVFVVLTFSSRSAVNIGIRHILPIFPYIYLLAGLSISAAIRGANPNIRHIIQAVVLILVLASFVSVILVAPRYLTYFNAIAGGPRNGYRWLVDSNLDWGQGISELGPYLAQTGAEAAYFEYSDDAAVRYYGVKATPLRKALADVPPSCVIAISATALQMSSDPTIAAFREISPDDQVANSILIFRRPAACARLAELHPGTESEFLGW